MREAEYACRKKNKINDVIPHATNLELKNTIDLKQLIQIKFRLHH